MSLDFNPENRTTWLEAINAVLIKTGRDPITSAPDDGQQEDPEVDAVRNHLDRVTREVLSKGWHFNTVKRTLDVSSGEIALDDDMIEFDPDDNDLATLNDKLHNRTTDEADAFTNGITGWAIIAHDLVDCPEVFRQYIYCRTATELAHSQFAETEFVNRLIEQEARALGRLLSSERRTRKAGLRSNREVYRTAGYRHRRYYLH